MVVPPPHGLSQEFTKRFIVHGSVASPWCAVEFEDLGEILTAQPVRAPRYSDGKDDRYRDETEEEEEVTAER